MCACSMNSSERLKCHKYENYDHPGECSPEKDYLR